MSRVYAIALLALIGCSRARPLEEAVGGHVHSPGILDTASPEFHGALLQRMSWKLDTCKECHAADLTGGVAEVSCQKCHGDPQTGCTTCHGNPPTSGAHVTHVTKKGYDCSACHVKPAAWTDAGHFNDKAVVTQQFNGATCSNVSCHAGSTTPAWSGGKITDCAGCHGFPPANHAPGLTQCTTCHAGATHLDGKVEVGTTCTGCHSQPPSSGAHVAHVTATHALSAPLACTACHAPQASNHPLDHGPAPAMAVNFDGTGCSATACHGPAQPVWTGGVEQIACGSCHAAPPSDAVHTGLNLTVGDCYKCHAGSIDGAGHFTSLHINGRVDVQNP